jgi:predicted enzyme related to lactoylglutathione lyase
MQIRSARFFVYATDLPRSLHFYTNVLGLQVVDRVIGGTVLSAGGTELEVLQERRDEEPLLDRRTGFTLFVDDADAAFAQLTAQSVPVLTELSTASDGSRVFYIADPDGLPIGILSEAALDLPPVEWLLDDQ